MSLIQIQPYGLEDIESAICCNLTESFKQPQITLHGHGSPVNSLAFQLLTDILSRNFALGSHSSICQVLQATAISVGPGFDADKAGDGSAPRRPIAFDTVGILDEAHFKIRLEHFERIGNRLRIAILDFGKGNGCERGKVVSEGRRTVLMRSKQVDHFESVDHDFFGIGALDLKVAVGQHLHMQVGEMNVP